jgi:hypothetical protein
MQAEEASNIRQLVAAQKRKKEVVSTEDQAKRRDAHSAP